MNGLVSGEAAGNGENGKGTKGSLDFRVSTGNVRGCRKLPPRSFLHGKGGIFDKPFSLWMFYQVD